MAEVSLALEIDRTSSVGRRLGHRRIRLDILDYPGEWLLDLPMLGLTYREWSEQTMALLRTSPRRECSADFLALVADLHPDDRAEESLLRKGHGLYRDALQQCRLQHGLRYLQPGRFICPGPGADAQFMWFFPLDDAPVHPKLKSSAALLQARFVAYQQHAQDHFFDTHFAAFDRQVMLVDVLGALYSGQAAFEDTARAIGDLAAVLRYGSNTIPRTVAAGIVRGASALLPAALSRAGETAAHKLEHRRIKKVAFVATKADHVPAMKRDNLIHLLRSLSGSAAFTQSNAGAAVSHRAAASILSTRDGTGRLEGRAVEVVKGIVLGEEKERSFFVGEVPTTKPQAIFWKERLFELPVFRPPPIAGSGRAGIPHLHLDQVLDDVIGDLL